MGTRGAYGFVIDGVTRATYNHYDSYPDALGLEVAKACKRMASTSIEQARSNAATIQIIDTNVPPTPAQIERCVAAGTVDLDVSRQSTNDWYCLLRKAQGKVESLFDGGLPFMSDDAEFLKDSLFCEYAYLVNFDTGELEVYKGFNKEWDEGLGRYAATADKTITINGKTRPNEYAGVALVLTIRLVDFIALEPVAVVDSMNEACKSESEAETE